MGTTPGTGSSGPGPPSPPGQPSQGAAALVVMLAVLCFIIAYCCWGAPCCRALCRRRCCCQSSSDLNSASASELGLSVDPGGVGATPTIILLPYGRMLVVDGSVFAQLHADTSGLDLIELGENVARASAAVTAVSVDSSLAETTDSKDICLSAGLPPPTYESIFGSARTIADMPPTYEEIVRQLRMHAYSMDELTTRTATVEEEEEFRPGEIRESRV